MKTLLKIFKTLVAIYIAVSGALIAIVYFAKRLVDMIPFTGAIKESYETIKKSGLKTIIMTILAWPYGLGMAIVGLFKANKVFEEALSSEDVKKRVKDMCDTFDETIKKNEEEKSKEDYKEDKEDTDDFEE